VFEFQLEITDTEDFNNLVSTGQYMEFWECQAFREPPRPR